MLMVDSVITIMKNIDNLRENTIMMFTSVCASSDYRIQVIGSTGSGVSVLPGHKPPLVPGKQKDVGNDRVLLWSNILEGKSICPRSVPKMK